MSCDEGGEVVEEVDEEEDLRPVRESQIVILEMAEASLVE